MLEVSVSVGRALLGRLKMVDDGGHLCVRGLGCTCGVHFDGEAALEAAVRAPVAAGFVYDATTVSG